jgi:hypothetical protein
MNIDTGIIRLLILSFGVFFLCHILLLRFMKSKNAIYGVITNVVLSLLLSVSMGSVFFVQWFLPLPLGLFFLAFCTYILLHILICTAYVLGILSIVDSSLHVKVIRELGDSGGGMKLRDISTRYATSSIIAQRLDRLVGAGELRNAHGSYSLARKHSLLFWRVKLADFFDMLLHG